MNSTEIIAEIRRLPLDNSNAVEKNTPRLESLAAELATHHISVRVGGYSKSGNHSKSYLYATVPGALETRVFECVTRSSGFFRPISGKSFAAAINALSETLKGCMK